MALNVFQGNCPANVSKDASYTIRERSGGLVVALLFQASRDERWLATTRDHSELADMVARVKIEAAGNLSGRFYINEYHQVIVPDSEQPHIYYFAGEYHEPLRFRFEDMEISGEARGPDGRELSPGDEWRGPHPGIPYALSAGSGDIHYKCRPRPNVEKKIRLSSLVGRRDAFEVARRISAVKGSGGGRFYVNEFGVIFAPVSDGLEYVYRYIGRLDDLPAWFPKPAVQPLSEP